MKRWNPNFITRVVTTLAVLPIVFTAPAEAQNFGCRETGALVTCLIPSE